MILRWTITFDGNRPVNRVRISVYSTSTDMVPEVEVDSGLPMYNVSSLLPFTNYTFGVVACNEIGCGLQSDLSPAVLTLNDSKQLVYVAYSAKFKAKLMLYAFNHGTGDS